MAIAYSLPSISTVLSDFSTLEGTVRYLIENGILYSELECSCGGRMKRNLPKMIFRCSRLGCRREKSLFHGTFFAKSKLRHDKVMQMAYFWLSKASTTQIVTYTQVSGKSVQAYYFQELVADTLDEEDFVIGGEGVVVEVDETKLGKRKYNRGHRVDGVWVFCAVEKTTERKVFLKILENRTSETLASLILEHIRPGSIVNTDGWRGYLDISAHNYEHLVVNHSIEFKNMVTEACTNTAEGTNNAIKILMPARKRTANCENCLFEFIWRRKNEKQLWDKFIEALKSIKYD